MNDRQPPRLVVYVPLPREKTHAALIELDAAGVVMQPRQQPPACNTRLSVVARNALKPILSEEQLGEIERQVEAGKLTLADLNACLYWSCTQGHNQKQQRPAFDGH